MLIGTLVRSEWRVQQRHPLVWLVLAGMAGFSLLVARGSPADPGSTASEALLRLNLFLPMFMLPFAAGALAPIALLREVEWDLAEIVGSYPLTLRQWLAVRLGHLAALLLAACMLAQLAFAAVLGADHPGEWPVLALDSLKWLAVIHLPACLIWAAGLGWVACRRAQPGLVYFAAGSGWIGYIGLASLTGTPLIAGSITAWKPLRLAMLVLDPYAITAMLNPVPDHGPLQWLWADLAAGRLAWVAIAVLLLRQIVAIPIHAGRRSGPAVPLTAERQRRRPAHGAPGHLGLHLRYLLRDRVFVLLVPGWIVLFLPEVLGGIDYAEPLSRITPDSRDALNRVVWDMLPMAGALLLLYAADRLCRLYQKTGMHELYGATPHRAGALLGVQLAALVLVALGATVLTGLIVATGQLIAGSPIAPGEYLVQLGLALSRLILFAVACVALHGLIRSRLGANIACLAVLVLALSDLVQLLGLFHPLWKPFSTPISAPDHVWGYAGGIAGHLAFLGVWAPLATAALLLAIAVANRTLPSRQVRLRRVLRSPALVLALALLAMASWQGLRIDRALRAEGALLSPFERAGLRADYERAYAHWAARAQPQVATIRARIAFYPHDNRATLAATLHLVNRSDRPISEVLIGDAPGSSSATIGLDGARVVHRDRRLGQTVFRLDRTMAPGEGRNLRLALAWSRSGLEPPTFPLVLEGRYSGLPASAVMPAIGFARELTLRDPLIRREHGLALLRRQEPSQLDPPSVGSLGRDLVNLDVVISTEAGHYAVGQGTLVRRWQQAGQAYFHYRTDRSIRSLPTFLSIAGEPQGWVAGPVTLLTHTPRPLRADNANLLAMRDTLDWLGGDVAPYPGTTLHLVALPEFGPSGHASPQIVQISDRLGFRVHPGPDAGFSQVYRRAVHETAHQWFGHSLGHGLVDERAFLVESLAKYAELVMIERRYGKASAAALVAFERDRYRHARLDPQAPVKPLIDAEETEDMYARATLAFGCLRHRIGDGPVVIALKLAARDIQDNNRPATSRGFIRSLKAAAPAAQSGAIDQLFLGTRPIEAVERELGCSVRDGPSSGRQ